MTWCRCRSPTGPISESGLSAGDSMSEWPSATWQWLWCFINLLIAFLLAIYDPSPAIVDDVAMLSAALLIAAIAVDIRRVHVLFLVASIGAILGAMGRADT